MVEELRAELERQLVKWQAVANRELSEPYAHEAILPIIKALLAIDERLTQIENQQ